MIIITYYWAFQVALVVRSPPANAGDRGDSGSIRGLGSSSGVGNGYPLQYSCLGNPWQKRLASDSPWGHKESDMSE